MIRMPLFSFILRRRFLKIFLLSRLRLLSRLSLLLCHASLLSAASSSSEKSDSERDESFRRRDLLRDRRCCNFSAPFPLGLSTKARDLLLLSWIMVTSSSSWVTMFTGWWCLSHWMMAPSPSLTTESGGAERKLPRIVRVWIFCRVWTTGGISEKRLLSSKRTSRCLWLFTDGGSVSNRLSLKREEKSESM